MDSQTLFDLFYAEKIQEAYIAYKKNNSETLSSGSSIGEKESGILNGLFYNSMFNFYI